MEDDPATSLHSTRSTSPLAGGGGGGGPRRKSMTEEEQRERRASIREIMNDPNLTNLERRRSIQSLMDGRRRSSGNNKGGSSIPTSVGGRMTMMAAAAAAAADLYDSDEDSLMGNTAHDNNPHNNNSNALSDSNHNNNNLSSSYHQNGSLHSIAGESVASVATASSVGAASGSRSLASRGSRRSVQNYPRAGRSASLKAFATGAAAVAAAAAAAAACDQVSSSDDDKLSSAERMEKSRPECDHYVRNCTIISPCCQLAFGCRICHDECPVLPPPIHLAQAKLDSDHVCVAVTSRGDGGGGPENEQSNKKQRLLAKRRSLPTDFDEEDTHHQIDRFAIEEIICRKCYLRQDSKTNACRSCGTQFGEYHCTICNLWMSADEDPYHCHDCGFCRVGGRDNFRHCHDCGMCIDALLFEDHNCKAGKYMSNCPVCQEDLFSSRSASHEMPCGHAIHWHCFRELTSFDTRCPVCKKTAETHEQMAPTWSAMAMGIALQPVPPEMARVVTIICNDCEVRDENRRWHFLGVQCLRCSSFNTTVERTTLMGREAAAFLEDQSSHHLRSNHSNHNISTTTTTTTTTTSTTAASAAAVAAVAAGGGGGGGIPLGLSSSLHNLGQGGVGGIGIGNFNPFNNPSLRRTVSHGGGDGSNHSAAMEMSVTSSFSTSQTERRIAHGNQMGIAFNTIPRSRPASAIAASAIAGGQITGQTTDMDESMRSMSESTSYQ